jgi:energy-coupling factor transporter ATP-binding protein EcfA2
MAIRLDHVRIHREGPLSGDFELEPGDLNLVYGRNETGKTYLVEALIRVLFAKGKRSQDAWALRDWDLKGRVSVSGLGEEPVRFTTTGQSLEEFWNQEAGLPPDLSRLLVVKGGDAFLGADAVDGVGQQVLRNYLSGEGLLDAIEQGVSATIREATIEDGQILGASRGELKTREQIRQDRTRMDALLDEVEERYGSGTPHLLRREIAELEEERDRLDAARRHRAAVVEAQLQEERRQQQALPDQETLARLSEQVGVYESKTADVEIKASRLTDLEKTSNDLRWTEKAAETYREITSGEGAGGTQPGLLVTALVFLVAAVGAGLAGWHLPMVACALVSAGLVGLHYWLARRTQTKVGEGRELERLKEEFRRRFPVELSDRAALEAQLEQLRENHIRASSLQKELEGAQTELRQLEMQIKAQLGQYTDEELEPGGWREALRRLRQVVETYAEKVRNLERSLDALGVKEEDRLEQDSGVEWDPGRYEQLMARLKDRSEELVAATGELDQLRTQALQELDRQDGDWEELIQALRDLRAEVSANYRKLTAEILGKIQVAAVVREFREQESERIEAALKSQALSHPLWVTTGRYNAVRQNDEGELVLLGEHDECPLSMASTGTREQAFLGLRMGFASHLMKGETGFLILDDAFQHSDWERRENCVRMLLELVNAGWQVFYLTMDDHLRDLFGKVGRELGERYREVALT